MGCVTSKEVQAPTEDAVAGSNGVQIPAEVVKVTPKVTQIPAKDVIVASNGVQTSTQDVSVASKEVQTSTQQGINTNNNNTGFNLSSSSHVGIPKAAELSNPPLDKDSKISSIHNVPNTSAPNSEQVDNTKSSDKNIAASNQTMGSSNTPINNSYSPKKQGSKVTTESEKTHAQTDKENQLKQKFMNQIPEEGDQVKKEIVEIPSVAINI